jgi:hypothetical protein
VKRVLVALTAAAVLVLSVGPPVYAQQGGNQTGPRDGTGKQPGKGKKGKRTGPRDGTGPIHPPGTGRQRQ